MQKRNKRTVSSGKTIQHGIGGYLRSLLTVVLALVLCFTAVYKVNPNKGKAEAGVFSVKAVHIQTTIDSETLQIVGGVVPQTYDKIALLYGTVTDEQKRIGVTALDAIVKSDNSFKEAVVRLSNMGDVYENESSGATNARLLTFPKGIAVQVGTMIKYWNVIDASAADEEKAMEVCNELISSLNQAFLYANNGNYIASGSNKGERVLSYKADMVRFLTAVADVYTSNSNTTTTYTGSDGTTAKIHGANGGDKITIEVNGVSQAFTFQVDSSGYCDVDKINWAHIAFEAFAGYLVTDESLQVSVDNVYAGKASSFEELLVDLFNRLANWIKNALGLWDIDKLVFNLGGRAAPSYVGGLYPASWEKTVWTLFFVSEIIAFVVLAIALLTNVLRKIMSTVNPIIRANLLDQAKDLLVVAFALGALPLLLQLLTSTASAMTGMMGDMISYTNPDGTISTSAFNDRFRILSAQGGVLGGVIMQFLYIAITISFNVLYTIRSYMLAALIIVAPIFVVLFAMGDNKKLLAKVWLMELLSNIFIQPIHGFVLSLVLILPGSSRPIEALVMLYCVLPISSIIRSLFFGNAGASPLRTAQNGIKAFKGNTQAAWRLGTGAKDWVKGKAHNMLSSGKERGAKSGETSGEKAEADGGRSEARGSDQLDPNLTKRMNPGGGPPTFKSQEKTPREQLSDDIKNKGEIPSAGLETHDGHLPDIAPSQEDGPDVLGGAVAGVGTAATVGAGVENGTYHAVPHGQGSDMADVVRRLPSQSGSVQYRVPRGDMRDAGFDSFQTKKGGGAEYMTTDTGYRGVNADGSYRTGRGQGAYSIADAKNYADMAKVFESGSEAQKDVLRKAGYDFVGAETKGGVPTGRFSVSTNKNFAGAMGYEPVARKDGGLNIQTSQGFNGEMPRTPDVGTMLNPEAYKRTTEGGQVGYTATGMGLQSEGPQAAAVMPVNNGIQQPDGSYEISAGHMESMGMTVAPAENGGVAVTYDAGIMGYDSDGAAVYSPESAMVMPDRQNVAQIQQMWEQGSDADRAWLNTQGVQSVMAQEDGHVTIVYNDAAEQAMGGRIMANEEGHVIVQPTAAETPVHTVTPIQSQPMQASEPHVVVPQQVTGIAYQPEQAAQVKVTPIQATQPITVEPVHVPAPEVSAPAPVVNAPTPVMESVTPAVHRDAVDFTPAVPEEYLAEQQKPGASQRMQRRQAAAKHDKHKSGKRSKRGKDWDDDYDY